MHLPSDLDPDRVDPYLLVAAATRFADYGEIDLETRGSFLVSIELKVRDKDGGTKTLGAIKGLSVQGAHRGSRFLTGLATPQAYAALLKHPAVARVAFAEVFVPRRPRHQQIDRERPVRRRAAPAEGRPTDVLLGMIDNGCPFAHREFRRPDGSTRVLRLWHQDGLSTLEGHAPSPHGFNTGSELTRSDLDALIAAATTSSGSTNEDCCYRLAGYGQLAHRQCHGAHSLGLLAATQRWTPRFRGIVPSRRLPNQANSVASDIVFVQLSQRLLDCVSVASLEYRTIDALRYIYNVGKSYGYEHILVSFGYESWMGPHDGTSWFEAALDSLVEEAKRAGVTLEVYMVAGNSKDRKAHAVLSGRTASHIAHWFVPPGNEVPTMMEVWVPASEPGLQIRVTPPGIPAHRLPSITWGETVAWPSEARAQFNVSMHRSSVLGRNGHVVLVRVAPTHTFDVDDATAPHGSWSVSVSGLSGSADPIHLRLGRVQADTNSPHRGSQPHFFGRTAKESELDSDQTLNGHACGELGRIAGVYYGAEFPYLAKAMQPTPGQPASSQLLQGCSTPYSGAGPTSGSNPKLRPDLSLPMEDGLLCAGVLSTGTRSGCIYRMEGTSTAAPAAAQGAADKRSVARGGPSSDPAMGNALDDPFA